MSNTADLINTDLAIIASLIVLIGTAIAVWRSATALKLWQSHVNDRLDTIEKTLTTNNGGSTVKDKLDKVLRRLGLDPDEVDAP
jgi:hypothetical protein